MLNGLPHYIRSGGRSRLSSSAGNASLITKAVKFVIQSRIRLRYELFIPIIENSPSPDNTQPNH